MRLCGSCTEGLLDGLKRRDWMRFVKPANAGKFGREWANGVAKKEDIDPYVVAALEIMAQAVKKARVHPEYDGCPICESSIRLARLGLRTLWVENVLEQIVRPLLISNGFIRGTLRAKRGVIETDHVQVYAKGGGLSH